jgi:RNA polymerase sigma-70 factor (ECF subfamily)
MDFEHLANQHKDAVYRQLMRACGNREDAEDVLIEALLKAYRHLDQLQDSGTFRAWLAQIGRRVCWQLKQREALLPILQLSTLEEEGKQIASNQESAESEVVREQMKSLLLRAIEQLPPSEREVYELRDIQGLDGEEVARRLHISMPAMKSRLHRGRSNLRKYLDHLLTGANREAKQLPLP